MRLRGVVRGGLYTTAALLLLALAVASYAAYLLNGEVVRLRVEAALTHVLGRPVTMTDLRLSAWTGAAFAEDFRIADDPVFSQEPFVQADNIRIGLDIPVLLLHRQIHIRSLTLHRPVIHLSRNAEDQWNYVSLAPAHFTKPEPQSHGATNVAISSIVVEEGSVEVRTVAADGVEARRSFGISTLQIHDLGVDRSSPFHFAAQLPAGGRVVASGIAGPWNKDDASRTPVQAHLEADHLHLSATGLVSADAPVSGNLEHAAVDLRWNGSRFNISQLRVDSSSLVLRLDESSTVKTGASHTATTTVWKRLLQRMTIHQAEVHAGLLEIDRATDRKIRLRAVHTSLWDWSPGGRARFALSADATSGIMRAKGSVRVPAFDGVQPMDIEADVSTSHLHLAGTGLLPEGTPVDAVADSTMHVQIRQHTMRAAGSFRLAGLRMTRNGQPSAMPVAGSFRLHQAIGENRGDGTLEQSTVQLGEATLYIEGNYSLSGKPPMLRLRVGGDQMPVNALESFLPSAGVVLPEGSRLQGGKLSLSLEVNGSPAHLEVIGPVRLEDARLAGFDLGSKLRSLASFTGGRLGSATVSGTEIRSLSFTLRAGLGNVVTDHLSAEIVGIGTATGAGSIGPGGALDYRLSLKLSELVPGNGGPSGLASELAGSLPPTWARRLQGAINYLSQGPMKNGVPLLIRGTTRKPTITPDLGALLPAERHH